MPPGHDRCSSGRAVKNVGSTPPPPAAGARPGDKPPVLVPGLGLRVGQVVAARYRVDGLVRCTASTVTLNAHHIHLREPVLLELLAAYGESDRAQCEARIAKARVAARFRSAHVPRIVDIGTTEDGMPYVATARLDGPTLEDELASRGRLPYEEAVSWILQACIGLAEAHGHGLVHGDLEPKRLVLASPETVQRDRPAEAKTRRRRHGEKVDPASRVLVVTDFGVADGIEALGEASASTWFGNPAYTAPEQLKNAEAVDPRADVWALGVLLYELVQGEPPFAADTVSSVLVSVAYDAAPLITEGPYDLARVVHRCLSKDPAARPQDVAEVARLLAPFAGAHGKDLVERVVATGASARALRDREANVRRARSSKPASPVAKEPGRSDAPPPVVRSVAPPPRRGKAPARAHEAKHLTRVIVDPDGRASHEPLPLVRRRDVTTRPSLRVVAERTRFTKIAATCAGAGLFLAFLGWAAMPKRADDVGRATTTNAIVSPAAADEGTVPSPVEPAEIDEPLVDPGLRFYEPLPALVPLDARAEPEREVSTTMATPVYAPRHAVFAPRPVAARKPVLAPNPYIVTPRDLPKVRVPGPSAPAPVVMQPKPPARPANAVRAPKANRNTKVTAGFGSRK